MTEPHRSNSAASAARSEPIQPASGSGSGVYIVGDLSPEDSATTGHVEVVCPECRVPLRVRVKYLGRHVRCQGCRAKFLVERFDEPVLPLPAVTPDPDDPWQGRAEVMRLLEEVQGLRARNARLQAEVDRLTRERDDAQALARDRDRSNDGPFYPAFGDESFSLLKDSPHAQGA